MKKTKNDARDAANIVEALRKSTIGKAVLGRKTGDVIDVTVEGELREWQITYVG